MEEWVLAASTSAWALTLLFGLVIGDGVIPIVPSEILLIAMATQTMHGQGPHVVVLFLVAFLGAFLGENLAYALGALIPIERMGFLRGGKGRRRVDAVKERLRQRGAAYILAARFIPGVRVVVNVCVGAAGYPRRRFVTLAAITSVLWTAFMIGLGVGAGHIFEGKPFVSMIVGIVSGSIIGTVIDRVLSRRLSGGDRNSAE
ncbi:VTT domain-containing protein [Actinomycetaceae bacterium L2_0104]